MSEVFAIYILINTSGLEPASHGSLPGSGSSYFAPLGSSPMEKPLRDEAKGIQVCLQEPSRASLWSRTSLDAVKQAFQFCIDTSTAKKEQSLHHHVSLPIYPCSRPLFMQPYWLRKLIRLK